MARRSIRKRRHHSLQVQWLSLLARRDGMSSYWSRAVGAASGEADVITFEEVWRREYHGTWPNEVAGKMRVVSVDKDAGTFTCE